MIDEVVSAAFYLSNQRWGGLVVIERETGLQDLANKGVPINGQVSSQLLVNLFVPNTPLHDGAVIIRQDQVVAAKVILPLSENLSKYERYGTRHKAALGISEQSDAVIVVISEETGHISVAFNGKLNTKLDRERLRNVLRSLLEPYSTRVGGFNLLTRNGGRKIAESKEETPQSTEPVGRGDKR
jgi:diadenylate cyclase